MRYEDGSTCDDGSARCVERDSRDLSQKRCRASQTHLVVCGRRDRRGSGVAERASHIVHIHHRPDGLVVFLDDEVDIDHAPVTHGEPRRGSLVRLTSLRDEDGVVSVDGHCQERLRGLYRVRWGWLIMSDKKEGNKLTVEEESTVKMWPMAEGTVAILTKRLTLKDMALSWLVVSAVTAVRMLTGSLTYWVAALN